MTRMFKPAPPPRGRAVSVYLPFSAFELVQPWAAGRARSARIGAILGRYANVSARPPAFDIREAGILVQLLGPLATVDDVAGLWGPLLDRRREGRALPDGIDAEELARKVSRFSVGEQLGLLELADRAASGPGTLRERLAAAGVEG